MISPFTIAVALRTLGSVGPNMVSSGGRLKSPSGADWAPIGNGVAARIIEVKSQGATRIGQILQKRSEEHTSELQSLMRISYAVFCLKKKKKLHKIQNKINTTYR